MTGRWELTVLSLKLLKISKTNRAFNKNNSTKKSECGFLPRVQARQPAGQGQDGEVKSRRPLQGALLPQKCSESGDPAGSPLPSRLGPAEQQATAWRLRLASALQTDA